MEIKHAPIRIERTLFACMHKVSRLSTSFHFYGHDMKKNRYNNTVHGEHEWREHPPHECDRERERERERSIEIVYTARIEIQIYTSKYVKKEKPPKVTRERVSMYGSKEVL